MGRDRGEQPTPDLFSTEMVRDGSPSPTSPIPATQPRADASSQRHVLPKNLRKAVKHLSDGELDLLHAAILEEMERRAIIRMLRETGGDKLQAARLLGIGKTTLYRKLKEYGIADPMRDEGKDSF